jgi:SAM-dependent methyltransferase
MINNVNKYFNPSISNPSYLVRKKLLDSILPLSKHLTGKMMDFGCGTKPYKSIFTVDEYVGVDFKNEGHTHEDENIDVFYDGVTIPFGDDHFDSIFCTEVFEHVFNLEIILKELNRVLKKDGVMLITCPFAICEHEIPNDFARYSSFGLVNLLERNNFKIIKQIKTSNAIETITQLRLTYIHNNITPKIDKIPILREIFRRLLYSYLNIKAIILCKILPYNDTLYLNNVILCKKI